MSQVDILPEPSRRIGWGLAALVVAGNMIGSGVYLLPATLAPTGSSSVIGWLVCGVGAVTLALVFGGLGRMQPEADGLSDFARRGLGRFLGYQTGLAYWAACLTGNVAVAVAGTGYLAFFFPALKEPMWGALSNLALIWLTTAAYAAGSKTAARFGAITLVLGLIPIGLAIIAGVIAFSGETFAASWSPAGEPLMKTVPASLAVIFWAFLGVESAAALSSQVKNPATDVGRASLGGVLLAFVVYVAASVAVFGVIPADVLAHSTSPYADLVARVMGASVAGLVAACAVIKATGTIAGWTMMGRDGPRLGRGGLAAALVRRGAEGQDAPVQSLDQRGHHERHGDRQRPADPGPAVRRADRRDLGADAVPLRPVFGDAVEADDQAGLASAGRRRGGVLGLCGRGGGGRLHLAQRRLFRRDQLGLAVGSQATGTRAGRIVESLC